MHEEYDHDSTSAAYSDDDFEAQTVTSHVCEPRATLADDVTAGAYSVDEDFASIKGDREWHGAASSVGSRLSVSSTGVASRKGDPRTTLSDDMTTDSYSVDEDFASSSAKEGSERSGASSSASSRRRKELTPQLEETRAFFEESAREVSQNNTEEYEQDDICLSPICEEMSSRKLESPAAFSEESKNNASTDCAFPGASIHGGHGQCEGASSQHEESYVCDESVSSDAAVAGASMKSGHGQNKVAGSTSCENPRSRHEVSCCVCDASSTSVSSDVTHREDAEECKQDRAEHIDTAAHEHQDKASQELPEQSSLPQQRETSTHNCSYIGDVCLTNRPLAQEPAHGKEIRNRPVRQDAQTQTDRKLPTNIGDVYSTNRPLAQQQEPARGEETRNYPARQDANTQTDPKLPTKRTRKQRTLLKPSSFVPRCAYALTKSMKMQKEGSEEKQEKPNARQYSRHRLEELAKPIKHHMYAKEETPPDLQKRPPNKTSSGYDSDDSFLERMEGMEKQRQQKLERAAAEALYDARVDKKVCSQCGATQTYDEMVEGRTKCPNDKCKNSLYQPPTKFVLKKFEERMERSTQRRCLVMDRVEEERQATINKTCQRMTTHQKALQEKVSREGNDFNARMNKDIEKRKEKIKHLAEHRVELLSKEYTFAPKLNVSEHLIRHRRGGWETLAKPLRRYTEEYQPPKEGRGRKKKQKRRRHKRLETPWQNDVDEDKMRQSFQQKIM